MPKCNADTRGGKSCCNPTRQKGDKCHLHDDDRSTCPICLYNICKGERTLECGHSFHKFCLEKWKKNGNYKCPTCRSDFDVPKFRVRILIHNTEDNLEHRFTALLDRFNIFMSEIGINENTHGLTEMEIDIPDEDDLTSFLLDIGTPLTDFDTTILDAE